MSDTHWQLYKINAIPDGEVLIHAGDFLHRGTLHELKEFNQWLNELPHKHKVLVAGNHDWICEKMKSWDVRSLFRISGSEYLCDSGVEIDGVEFYGSPYQPAYYDWAFNLPRGGEELKEKWAAIPDTTNVLVTHTPPSGILDAANDKIKKGDEDLMKRIKELPSLRLHVFGHIHEGYGRKESEGKTFINAAVCNIRYEPVNPIQVFEL